jgi:hypothetical protein
MRRLLLILPLTLLVPAARADDVTDLRDRVLKAQAKDPADLKKFRTFRMKAKGVSKLAPEPLPGTFEMAAVYPSHMRLTWEFGTGPMKNSVTLCGADDRGWKAVPAFQPTEMSVEEVNDFRADAYAIWVSTLVTLDDRNNKLSAAGRDKVDSAPVVGLKVSRRPWPEVTLWFGEKSGLLRKAAYQSREAGALLSKELIYDGHKDVGGLMVPTKHTMRVNHRDVYLWTDMEYAFPDRIDPAEFAKPK